MYKTAGWLLLFFVSGPCLILLNSHVLKSLNFRYPVFFSSLGIWGSVLLAQLLVRSGLCQLSAPPPSIAAYNFNIAPLSLISALAIAIGNSVYMHQSVSFTQMLKALGPVYVLTLLYAAKMKQPSAALIAAVTVIVMGTGMASFGETQFSITGFTMQIAADIVEASKLVLLQWLMNTHKFTPLETMYYVFPVTGLWLTLLVVGLESGVVQEAAFLRQNVHLVVVAMSLGFTINLAGNAVIQELNSLTFKLIGVVRNNLLVLAAIFLFGESSSPLQATGYGISVFGFIWYTYVETGETLRTSKYAKLETTEEDNCHCKV